MPDSAVAAFMEGYRGGKAQAAARPNRPPPTDLTEDGLAAEFTRRHRDHLRYVAAWSAWMHWNGQCWERETTLRAFDLARDVCRDAGAGLNNAKLRARILSAGTGQPSRTLPVPTAHTPLGSSNGIRIVTR